MRAVPPAAAAAAAAAGGGGAGAGGGQARRGQHAPARPRQDDAACHSPSEATPARTAPGQ